MIISMTCFPVLSSLCSCVCIRVCVCVRGCNDLLSLQFVSLWLVGGLQGAPRPSSISRCIPLPPVSPAHTFIPSGGPSGPGGGGGGRGGGVCFRNPMFWNRGFPKPPHPFFKIYSPLPPPKNHPHTTLLPPPPLSPTPHPPHTPPPQPPHPTPRRRPRGK